MLISKIYWFLALLLIPALPSFSQSYSQALTAQLDSIALTDQLYRNDSVRRAARSQQEDDTNMNKQAAIDRLNLAKIDRIIARYGYPGRSLVGEKRQSIAFLVIQHSDLDVQEKYLPLLTQAAEKGELKASSLTLLIDRIRVGQGQKQLYGSQLRETKQGIKVFPIEEEAQVNQRRASVGLPPLEDYLRQWHITYRVPTATYTNPDSLYYRPAASVPASVEVIGGWDSLYQKVVCPPAQKEMKGTVTIQFTVDKNGVPKDLQVIRSLGTAYDDEALRVLEQARFTNPLGEDHELRARVPFTCAN